MKRVCPVVVGFDDDDKPMLCANPHSSGAHRIIEHFGEFVARAIAEATKPRPALRDRLKRARRRRRAAARARAWKRMSKAERAFEMRRIALRAANIYDEDLE